MPGSGQHEPEYAARISPEQAINCRCSGYLQRLDELKYDVLKELEANVNQVNALADQIADLNQNRILAIDRPEVNEMLDERDPACRSSKR